MARRITIDGIETLDDIVAEGLDVLFVGYNPSLLAVERAHYYPRTANRFWEDLHEAGFVPRVLRGPGDDLLLPTYGIGLTDLIKRPSPNVDDLKPAEFSAGFRRLAGLVEHYRPRFVCFNGLGLMARFERAGLAWPSTRVRVVPSTSPRNQGLKERRLAAFRALKQEVDAPRQPGDS